MFKRDMQPKLLQLAKQYPVVTVTGPRQSGKTTLCRTSFPDYTYVSLEDPMQRDFANSEPQSFLEQHPGGIILDEIQRCPDLPAYIQTKVDNCRKNGLFILTGSHNFSLVHSINQSLAGRTALLKLLPLCIHEREDWVNGRSLDEIIYTGFYPRIHDQQLEPSEALSFYFATYVERDIRALANIHNLSLFQKFLKLCAGRIGQLLNLTSLSNETGVSHTTIRAWLTLLEASYIIFLLPPHFNNYNKRLTKSPKLYFYDVGLAAYLLGIQNSTQISRDPLRGQLFENLIITDLVKNFYNEAREASVSFFRDSGGHEVDLLLPATDGLASLEIKSSQNLIADFFKGLEYFSQLKHQKPIHNYLVYGGKANQKREIAHIYSYQNLFELYQNL